MAKTISILGIPMDLGQSRRGVDMGPSAVRYAGLDGRLRRLGYTVADGGNVDVPERDTLSREGGMGYAPAVESVCGEIYERAREALAAGSFPLFLGGDHSVSLGTVGGVTHDEPVGLVWVDAHGDFNTPETTPTGNLHGMVVASLLGRGAPGLVSVGRPGPKLRAEDVVMIGTRSLDPEERTALRESGIAVFTMREVDEGGMARVAESALRRLAHRGRIHVSLDMDVVDPNEAPGVGTPVAGGLAYREAHLLMETLADSGKVGSADVVEINPILDEKNRTARMAVDLVASLLGEAIL